MHTFQFHCTKTLRKWYDFNDQATCTNSFAFWVKSCSKNFYKIAWSSFINSKESEHKNYYLLRRHAAPGEDISRNLNCKGNSDLFVATSGFFHEFEKICDKSNPEIEFSDLIIDSVQLTLSFISQKLDKVHNLSWEMYKAVLPAKIQFWFS